MLRPGTRDRTGKVRRWVYWVPAVFVAAVIFVLSSVPDFGALQQPFLQESDKVLHALVYAVLAGTVLWGLEEGFGRPVPLKRVWLAALVAAVYGITDEIHQRFVPGRMGIWQDWVADAVGAILGAWLVWGLMHLRSMGRVRRT